jgi:hypothetical protein
MEPTTPLDENAVVITHDSRRQPRAGKVVGRFAGHVSILAIQLGSVRCPHGHVIDQGHLVFRANAKTQLDSN